MAQRYHTDVLTQRQLMFIAEYLPEPHEPTGRPAYSNLQLLPGILKVLRSGCRWRDLDYPGYPSGVTHWRRLRYWKKSKRFKKLWNRVLDVLVMGKRLNHSVLSIDGTLIRKSHRQGSGTGASGPRS